MYEEELLVKPRHAYLTVLALIATFGSINLGYNVVRYNSCINLLNDQLGWTGDKANLYTSIISGMPSVGNIIGSIIAPMIMSKVSRRSTLILVNIAGIVGVSITLVKNFYAFCIGGLIYGTSFSI